jgi:PAS domain S-box-containing protein
MSRRPARTLSVLILEDRESDAKLVARQLRKNGLDIAWNRVTSETAFRQALDGAVDVILADYQVPGVDVKRVLSLARERSPETPFLVVSGSLPEQLGIELMKLGADDYVIKDRPERLGQAIERCMDRTRARREARAIETRYRSLFEHLPVGFVSMSASGELIDGNAALLRLAGFPDVESMRKVSVLDMYVDPADRILLLERLAQDGVVTGFETRFRRADGMIAWVRSDLRMARDQEDGPVLIDGLIFDISERRQAEEELRRSLEALHLSDQRRQRLLHRLVDAQEAERRRIAADIHDDAVQVMAAAVLRLATLRRRLTDDQHLAPMQRLEETVSLAVGRLRNLLFELNPAVLDSHGLVAAVRAHLEQHSATDDVTWEIHNELASEPESDLRLLIYRITQEALVNVRKHAGATKVSVVFEERDGGVLTQIRDNGRGFSMEGNPAPGHLGLASMKERAELGGGWWELESEPGGGATVKFWLPFRSVETRTP